MTQYLKPFDDKLKEYKQILPKIRYVMRKGITPKNSWEYYNIQPSDEVLEFI